MFAAVVDIVVVGFLAVILVAAAVAVAVGYVVVVVAVVGVVDVRVVGDAEGVPVALFAAVVVK